MIYKSKNGLIDIEKHVKSLYQDLLMLLRTNIALLCHLQNPVTAVKVSSIDCSSVLNFSPKTENFSLKTEILNCLALILIKDHVHKFYTFVVHV